MVISVCEFLVLISTCLSFHSFNLRLSFGHGVQFVAARALCGSVSSCSFLCSSVAGLLPVHLKGIQRTVATTTAPANTLSISTPAAAFAALATLAAAAAPRVAAAATA